MLRKTVNLIKKHLGDTCIEFSLHARKGEVVASIPVEGSIAGDRFLEIYRILKGAGFRDFTIYEGECNLVEDRYRVPEIVFKAKEGEVDEEILELLKMKKKLLVCGRR